VISRKTTTETVVGKDVHVFQFKIIQCTLYSSSHIVPSALDNVN